MKCFGKLIYNTGISAGNYKYCETKADYDNWFLSKAKQDFDDYSVIRPDPQSKNGFNVACINLDLPYSEITECDYVSFKHDEYDRYYHCQVVDREYISEKTCRLYIVIDYVATFYDTIKLKKSFVERTHVTDDFGDYGTASKYLLPEPFSVEIRQRPDLKQGNPFSQVNQEMTLTKSSFCLISSVDKDGQINLPKIKFQAGGAISGFLYYGTKETIEEIASKYVTFMSKMINKSTTLLENITHIYVCPDIVARNTSTVAHIMDTDTRVQFWNFMNTDNIGFDIKNAKVWDYFRYVVSSPEDTHMFAGAEYGGAFFNYSSHFTGGHNGRATIRLRDTNNYDKYIDSYVDINSPSWAAVSIAGNVFQNDYSFNMFKGLKNNVARRTLW